MIRAISRLIAFSFLALPIGAQIPSVHEHACKVAIPNARCGSIQVPENSNDPAGRKINIEFIQVRSTAKDRDPAAWINVDGGPGIASTPGIADVPGIFSYVLRRRDMVIYDQRGTGASTPLHCDLYSGIDPREAADFLPEQGVRRCYEQVSVRADLSHYTTTDSVEDLEQLRAALGYNKIVLHALSYGTRLSQAYMQAHAEHVSAAILEGVLRPGARIPLDFARGMQRTLDAVLQDCQRDPSCRPVAEQIHLAQIARLEHIPVGYGGATLYVTPQQFFEALRPLLYDGERARRVPLILSEVSRGDTDELSARFQAAHHDDPYFSWPLWLSITCAEDTPFIREEQIGPATLGTVAGDYRIRQQQRACKFWPVPKSDPAVGKPASVPVLLIEGELDLVTPPWPEADLHRYFPNGHQLTLPLTGHTPMGLIGSECVDNIEEQFLLKLDNKSLDVGCVNGIRRKPFIVEERKPSSRWHRSRVKSRAALAEFFAGPRL